MVFPENSTSVYPVDLGARESLGHQIYFHPAASALEAMLGRANEGLEVVGMPRVLYEIRKLNLTRSGQVQPLLAAVPLV